MTSLDSVSPALPKKTRRYKKKRSRDDQEEIPPEIPVKGKQDHLVAFPNLERATPCPQEKTHKWLIYCAKIVAHDYQRKLRFNLTSFCCAWHQLWGCMWNASLFYTLDNFRADFGPQLPFTAIAGSWPDPQIVTFQNLAKQTSIVWW